MISLYEIIISKLISDWKTVSQRVVQGKPSYLRCEVPMENAFEVKVAEAHCYVIGQFHPHSPGQMQVTV